MIKKIKLIIVGVSLILMLWLLISIDAFEMIFEWSRQHEEYNIDEWILLLPIALFALSILAFHMWKEAKQLNQKLQYEITERIQVEEQLRHSQKMEALGILAGGIAHDFNNILLIMLGNTEYLIRKIPQEHEDRKKFESILSAGKRATDLVRQILTFSHMESTTLFPLNLTKVLQEALDMVRATIPSNIEIHSNLTQDMTYIMGDKTQIHQIIFNLCTNAYHAMEEDDKGRIEISLKHLEDCSPHLDIDGEPCLELMIKDTGYGISEIHLEKIFDPFFTTKEIGKGTGLGLSVVHGLVKNHNGKVEIESQKGKGVSVYIFFPTIEENEKEETTSATPQINQGEGHILLVEDDLAIVEIYRELLKETGYTITISSNGEEALRIFKKTPDQFDLVFTDQAMPKMTGKQLSQELLKIRPDLPIILSTGHSDIISNEEAQTIGIRRFFIKPIDLKEVLHLIQECLQDAA